MTGKRAAAETDRPLGHGWVVGLIALLALAAYSNSLRVPFVLDGAQMIERDTYLHVERLTFERLREAILKSWWPDRPLTITTFVLNYRIGGLDVTGYHLVNLSIHILAGLGVYLLLLELLALAGHQARRRELAAVAALLWTVHPVQIQAVTYIVQRATSLCGMFYVWSLVLYLVGRRSEGKRRGGAWGGAMLLLVCAALSKQLAGTLPLAILLIELLLAPERRSAKTVALWVIGVGLLFASAAVYYLASHGGISHFVSSTFSGEPLPGRKFSAGQRLLTQSRVVLFYLSLLLLPLPGRLNLDHHFPLSTSLFAPPVTGLAVLGLLALVGVAIRCARRSPLIAFGILWFGLHLAIESTVVSLELAFEHRLYLPSIGMLLVAVLLLSRWLPADPRRLLVWGGVALALTGVTYDRNRTWRDRETLWSDCMAKSPDKARSHVNLGMVYLRAKKLDLAAERFRRALEIAPDHGGASKNLGGALVQLGRHEEARAVLEAGLKHHPRMRSLHHNLGSALHQLRKLERAEAAYLEALRIGPRTPLTLRQLAIVRIQRKRYAEARVNLEEALSLVRDDRSLAVLGELLVRQGKLDDAVEALREALALNKRSRVRGSLVKLLTQQGLDLSNGRKYEEASKKFLEVLAYRPLEPNAVHGLATCYWHLEDRQRALLTMAGLRETDPAHVPLYFNKGKMMELAGRRAEAIQVYRRILQLNPQHAGSRQRLQLLRRDR